MAAARHGTPGAFDDFVQCLVGLHLGSLRWLGWQLPASSSTASALARLERLEVDFRWHPDLRDLAALGLGNGHLRRLTRLRSLAMDFGACSALASAGALGAEFGALPELRELELGFSSCGRLASADWLSGLGDLTLLEECRLDFARTAVSCVIGLGSGLGKLGKLRKCALSFEEYE